MSTFDKLANLALIVVCSAVTVDIVARRLAPEKLSATPARTAASASSASSTVPTGEYSVGDAFPALAGLKMDARSRLLVLAVKDTCRYCTASMPFYQRLVQTVHDQGSVVRLVGVCPTGDSCADYFKQHAVPIEETIGVTAGAIKIVGTPTVIHVTGGKVTSVWTGQLSPAREEEVLAAIASAARAS
jgi:hypothetical protein